MSSRLKGDKGFVRSLLNINSMFQSVANMKLYKCTMFYMLGEEGMGTWFKIDITICTSDMSHLYNNRG